MVRVKVVRGNKKFGVVALGNEAPTWGLFVGSQGHCEWSVGGPLLASMNFPIVGSVMVGAKVDFQLLKEVDVILVQGPGPPRLGHPLLWQATGMKVVLWSAGRTRGGRRSAPEGWSSGTRRFTHSHLGGVSDGVFTLGFAFKEPTTVEWGPSAELFPNHLAQIWKPTTSGRNVNIPDANSPTENTVMGLLTWKTRRTCFVTGPTVFSKVMWISRKLTRRELADAADMPADLYKRTSEEGQRVLANQDVPGKVLAAAIASLRWRCGELGTQEGASRSEGIVDEGRVSGAMTIDSDCKTDAKPRLGGKRSDGAGDERGLPAKKRTKTVRFEGALESPKTLAAVLENLSGKTTVSAKAVKSGTAGVPTELWDRRLIAGLTVQDRLCDGTLELDEVLSALRTLRRFGLRYWRRNVVRSFFKWFDETNHGAEVDKQAVRSAGLRALGYVHTCSWWEWTGGSGIFFWRWPLPHQQEMREGVSPYFVGGPPTSLDRQPPYKSDETRDQVLVKVGTVVEKGYIEVVEEPSRVRSLMYMFHVPKGLDDVRMVYDGSKSGLNAALFAPWFYIHSVDMMCWSLLPGYWCGDNDYGEQFLNFNLHPTLQQYCGVDLSQLMGSVATDSQVQSKEVWGVWTRCAMGLRPSPYTAVKGALIARRCILGNRLDPANPFAWAAVRLNQPGDAYYQPNLPWLMLVREDGHIATAICQYIDDLRTCAHSEAVAWASSCRIAKVLSWLGLQDAARKRREPSQEPGAWSGATVITAGVNVYQSVTTERWEKAQRHVRWIGACIGVVDEVSRTFMTESEFIEAEARNEEHPIDHKRLESSRGFLVYVSNTYKAMVPFLKGIHLTVDSWRSHRDVEGWKLAYSERKLLPVEDDDGQGGIRSPPKEVFAATRLKADMEVLMSFTNADTPPQVPARPSRSIGVYMVGDASGTGFGGSTWEAATSAIEATFGGWDEDTMGESSNFREALNLVLMLEHQVESGQLEPGSEVFVFTDNSTAERAFNKGSSSSKKLHELVVRLRRMEMHGMITPRFVWISGERMIAQGTDGLSRGDLTCGVMQDGAFLKHIPLNKTALDYGGTLIDELSNWLPGKEPWIMLTEEGWFEEVFKNPIGSYVWTPSAALARVAIEQLCEVKHIHPGSRHLLITPALMTGGWRKLLGRQSDALLTLPVGPACWPWSCFEPLVISLTCPLLKHSPWLVRNCEWVGDWQQELRSVWQTTPEARRSCMRKFWALANDRT